MPIDPGLLREARARAGLSQQDIAARLGVTQPTVSNWEQGRTQPRANQMAELEVFLDLTPEPPEGEGDEDEAPSSSPFGEWLSRTRAQRGMTRKELAERSGVSEPQIFNIEKGNTRNPRSETRTKLADTLGDTPSPETVEITETDAQIPDVGILTDFDPHDDDDLPEDAGIYVLYDISERPVYVGESDSIRRRVRDHADKFWFKRPIVETAAFVRIENNRLRRQVESTMIRFLKSNAVINRQNVRRG